MKLPNEKRALALAVAIIGILVLFVTTAFAQSTWIVDQAGGGDFLTIQAGIDAASDGDTVLVEDGTYTGTGNVNIDFLGKEVALVSRNGADSSIIDCQNTVLTRGVIFQNGETTNTVLDGFTVRDGRLPGTYRGAGIMIINGSSPTIRNCTITKNKISITGSEHGGGIYCEGEGTNPSISNCFIYDNQAKYGAGIRVETGASPLIIDTIIDHNSSRDTRADGAGIHVSGSAIFINCRITNNHAPDNGGAYRGSGQVDFFNCLFSGNSARGATFNMAGNVSFTNCTITANSSSVGVLFSIYSTSASCQFINTIVYGNEATEFRVDGTLSAVYSDIEGGYPGEGNIDSDPLFVSGTEGNYYLSHIDAGRAVDSPCIDAGEVDTDSWDWDSATTRTDGYNDVCTVDMGYHYGPGIDHDYFCPGNDDEDPVPEPEECVPISEIEECPEAVCEECFADTEGECLSFCPAPPDCFAESVGECMDQCPVCEECAEPIVCEECPEPVICPEPVVCEECEECPEPVECPEVELPEPIEIVGGEFIVADPYHNIVVTSLGRDAGHDHELYVVIDDVETFLFNSADQGTEVSLGTHPAGTIVRFMLRDLTSGYDYFTGNGSLNPDGIEHVMLTSTESSYAWEFGFEDVFDGGDMDFNDCMFLVENVLGTPSVVQPEVPVCDETTVDTVDSTVRKAKLHFDENKGTTNVQVNLDAIGIPEGLGDGSTLVQVRFFQGDEVVEFTGEVDLNGHGPNLMDKAQKKEEEKKEKEKKEQEEQLRNWFIYMFLQRFM